MTSIFIRPDVRLFLEERAKSPRPAFSDELIASIRKMPHDAMAALDLPVGELAVVQDIEMPGPCGAIALRLFDTRPDRTPSPVVIFYHGGGFVGGSIITHAGLAAEISRVLDLPVISVEYRLAPEHKWPAAPDDAEAAVRWIVKNSDVFQRNFTGLILCGDSAGGNLAIVTALALHTSPTALPVELIWPIYPVVDLEAEAEKIYESSRIFADGYGLLSSDSPYFHKVYAPAKGDWRAAPLHAELKGLPPILMVTAALDPLRDQGRAFAAKAITAGVTVFYKEYAGTVHGFATFRASIPSARADTQNMIASAATILDRVATL